MRRVRCGRSCSGRSGHGCRQVIPPPDGDAEKYRRTVNWLTAKRPEPCDVTGLGGRCPNTRGRRLGHKPRSTRTFLAARPPTRWPGRILSPPREEEPPPSLQVTL